MAAQLERRVYTHVALIPMAVVYVNSQSTAPSSQGGKLFDG